MELPRVVSATEWQAERDALLVKEKAATRTLDALAAERRGLPMVRFGKEYVFDGPDGPATLLDLFDGRRQLIVYHAMQAAGSDYHCSGCAMIIDHIGPLAHLHARDVTLVLTSPAPIAELLPYQRRMGWTRLPWFSAYGNDFTADCGVGDGYGVSVFLRDGDQVYRTYFTTSRGGDQLMGVLRYLDLTPFGRQESWEESGHGTDTPGSWWRLHDEYEPSAPARI